MHLNLALVFLVHIFALAGLPHPGKVLDFFAVVESWWILQVLENVNKVFSWFTRTECELFLFFFIIAGTL